ncbi:MAG: hypothetical protein QOK44_3936 [Betaproteobacteria bacterium]|jgi:hypothetical protein|nr:hypothetical protein [Betaproteobacteria bacterium]
MKSIFAACLTVIALSGCVTSPIPEGYTGPTATIRDSALSDSSTRARFFYVSEVDGRSIRTSLQATRSANHGRGFSLSPAVIERQVPAAVVKLKLEGRTAYGAPIQELVMAARMYSVEEVVEAELRPGTRYVVKGRLEEGKTAVWLEEQESRQRVGRTVEPK